MPYPLLQIVNSQKPPPLDTTAIIDAKKQKRIENIIGTFLYYVRAIDSTMIKALNSLSIQQSKPTVTMEKQTNHFL